MEPEETPGAEGLPAVPAPALKPTGAAPWRLMRELSLAELDGVAGVPRLSVQLLHNRGITGEAAVRRFLAGEWAARPPAPLDLDAAVERVQLACRRGERIAVYGDFDCDGVTSCALLTAALRTLGATVAPYVPMRDADGRGLNLAAVTELGEAGTRLIITTDCGSANVAEVAAAQAAGMDVIVTDHHPLLAEVARPLALVNPRRPGDPSPNKDLAGVGVAFRLAEQLLAGSATLTAAAHDEALHSLLDLVAIGTIADMVPLAGENHALARAGLVRLNTRPRPGLLALVRLARLTPGHVTARDISFALAPRLNAAGRLGNPQLAVELLLEEHEAAAAALADRLDTLNTERQREMDTVAREARRQLLTDLQDEADGRRGHRALFAVGAGWHVGVLGLVAGRLAEEFHRPVFIVSQGEEESRGSARAPHGYDLGAALAAREPLFRRFGGHAQAAGFTLATSQLAALRSHVEQHFDALAAAGQAPAEGDALPQTFAAPAPTPLDVDCRLPLRRLAADIYASLDALEPFGPGFAPPQFLSTDVNILSCWRSGPEGRNLRLRLRDGKTTKVAVWARHGDQFERLRAVPPDRRATIVYTLSKDAPGPQGAPSWLIRILALDLS